MIWVNAVAMSTFEASSEPPSSVPQPPVPGAEILAARSTNPSHFRGGIQYLGTTGPHFALCSHCNRHRAEVLNLMVKVPMNKAWTSWRHHPIQLSPHPVQLVSSQGSRSLIGANKSTVTNFFSGLGWRIATMRATVTPRAVMWLIISSPWGRGRSPRVARPF